MDVGTGLDLISYDNGGNECNFNQESGFPVVKLPLFLPDIPEERRANQRSLEFAGGGSLFFFLLKFPIPWTVTCVSGNMNRVACSYLRHD